jgi:PAS domain S-box-containing protein
MSSTSELLLSAYPLLTPFFAVTTLFFALLCGWLIYKIRRIRRERNQALRQSEADAKILFLQSRYASMGETVRNIAHQWKQPLNAIGSILNGIKAAIVFQGEIPKEKLLSSVETSFRLLHHLAGTIDTFYGFLAQRGDGRSGFSVADELEKVRKITEYSFENSNITLTFEIEASPTIQGNANEFTHAILNLILNAKDAFDTVSVSEPTITVGVVAGAENCTITVSDNAGGIRLSPIDMVFDLHITTKEEGSGLGLFMTKNIIEKRFGGKIAAENIDGGARFTLELPYAEYGEYFTEMVSPDERQSLERINQLSHKIIELEAVEKALQKWADIFEQAQWGIVMCGAETMTLDLMNPAFARMHGFEVEELLRQPIESIFAPEYRDNLQCILHTVHQQSHYAFESVHIRKDGSRFPVAIDITAVKDDQENVLYRIANVRDITAHKEAEENLRLKEFALDHIQEAVFLIDQHGRFQYVNERACRVLGYSREEMIELGVSDVDPEWPRERWPEHWVQLKAAGSIRMQLHHRRKDGTTFPVEVSANYIEFGGEGYNMAIARDITERLQLEAEKETRALKTIAENVPDNIARWDIEGRYLYINPVQERLLGITLADVIGKRLDEAFPEIDFSAIDGAIAHVVHTGEPIQFLRQLVPTEEGEMGIHEINFVPERDANGTIISVLGVGRDMTNIYRLQEELAEREKELRSLADSSPGMMGAFHRRPEGSVSMPYVSPNIVDIFGVTPDQAREDASALLALTHPDDAQRLYDSIAQSAQSMSVWHEEYRIHHPTKGERWMESNTMPQPHPQGGIVWYGYVHDVTERKRIEKELEDSHAFLTKLIDSLPDPIFVKDRAHRWLILNKANYEFAGMEPGTLIGKSDYDFFPKAEADIFWEKDEEVFTSGTVNVNEEYFTSADGVAHYIQTRKAMFTGLDGKEYLVGTIRDLSERKKMEDELRLALEFNEGIIGAIPDLLFEVTPEGIYVGVWAQDEALLATQKALLLGHDFKEILPPDVVITALQAMREVDEKGFSLGKTYSLDLPDGKRWFELSVSKKKMSGNYIVLSRDVTERKEAEDTIKELNATLEQKVKERTLQLQESLELTEGVIHALPDLLFEIDREGRYLNVWARDEELLAAQKERLLGHTLREMLSAESADTVMGALAEAESKGVSFGKIIRLELPIGTRYFEQSVAKKSSSDTFLVLSRDITERVEMEKQLKMVEIAINGSGEAFYINDMSLSIIYVNDAACRMLGYTKKRTAGDENHRHRCPSIAR